MKYILGLILFATASFAQFSADILSEAQLGNLPNSKPDDLRTSYNQLNLNYRALGLNGGIRYESFNASEDGRTFGQLAQRYVEYEQGPFKARVGNFYKTFGRGLILRGYELPGVVFEQRQFRRRYAYYRDFDGFLVEGTWNRFEISVLQGNALDNSFPPEIENINRRLGNVQGAEIKVRPFSWLMLGDAYLKTDFDQRSFGEFNTFFSELSLNQLVRKTGLKKSSLKVYAEHARQNSTTGDFFSTSKSDPHATYVSLNLSVNRFGLSAEYKDYQGFENKINVPPILYMEHGYYLLNRNSKELLSDYENGFQFEMTFRPTDKLFLLANTSFAQNDLGYTNFDFAERFFEITAYPSYTVTAKAFYDWAKDELKSETDRKTGGVNFDWEFKPGYAVTIDAQQQKIIRSFGSTFREELNNTYLSATFSKSPLLSIGFALDRSTDPVETDDPATFAEVETEAKYWQSVVASFQLNMSHEISLFYGSRRGGLVCLSGTCYEVLPFKGVELRWTGHF